MVPLTSCEEAAKYLVDAFGGEDKAREVVGGFKWWQARTIEGYVPTQFALRTWADLLPQALMLSG